MALILSLIVQKLVLDVLILPVLHKMVRQIVRAILQIILKPLQVDKQMRVHANVLIHTACLRTDAFFATLITKKYRLTVLVAVRTVSLRTPPLVPVPNQLVVIPQQHALILLLLRQVIVKTVVKVALIQRKLALLSASAHLTTLLTALVSASRTAAPAP